MRQLFLLICIALATPAKADLRTSQMKLNAMGYNAGPVDGLWGRKTESAIKRFLNEKGEDFDGTFDYESELISESYNKFISKIFDFKISTTSRYKRSKYNCYISNNLHKIPKTAFSAVYSDHLFGFAKLDGDEVPDLVQGYAAEPLNPVDIREPLDYVPTLSSGKNLRTKLPNLLARKILVQDFNLDEKDDVIFLNYGPHDRPTPGFENRILLSNGNEFLFQDLPGGSMITHGGAAGDLDGDGDVDVVVANGQQRNVQLLTNKGNGRFAAKTIYSKFPAEVYTAEIWDLDQDGYLDLIFGTVANGIYVAWGNISPKDSPVFSKLINYNFDILKDRLPLDFAFADFDKDGKFEMAILDTRIYDNRYRGWGLTLASFDSSRRADIESLVDFDPGMNFYWIPWIDDCDIDSDGAPDLVSIAIGKSGFWYFETPKLIFWRGVMNWEHETLPRNQDARSDNFDPKNLKSDKLCQAAISDRDWKYGTEFYDVAKDRNLTLSQCIFYSNKLLPWYKYVGDEVYCLKLIFNGDWKKNVQIWVREAGSRRFDRGLCETLFDE